MKNAAALFLLLSLVPAQVPIAPVPVRALKANKALLDLLARRNVVELPTERLRRNWTSPWGAGSCMHASLRHLLHWQGAHELAEWWGQRYSGGESFNALSQKLSDANVNWAAGLPCDEGFLDKACAARRGAVVTFTADHAVALVGIDDQYAYVLDPNSPKQIQRFGRSEFLADWISRGGMALTPLAGPPAPPSPWTVTEAVVP